MVSKNMPSLITRRTATLALALAMMTGCAARRGHRRWGSHRAKPVAPIGGSPQDQFLEDYRAETGVKDFSVRILRSGETLYARDVGDYGPLTQINIASASKWLVGATAMAQVDAGRFRLEDAIGEYVTGLPRSYASLRIESLLSFTAGLPSLRRFLEFRQPENITLAESAILAARTPLASKPGARFDYGGANLQFIGAAIEAVNRRSWHDVFHRDIAAPLGLELTLWGRMNDRPAARAPITNPVLQAGAWSSADDYARFLTMIAQGGLFRGRRILTEDALGRLATLSTVGVEKGFTAPGTEGQRVEYLLAHWCEGVSRIDPHFGCSFESSPGFYGAYPWIDWSTGVYGIIFQKDRLQRVADETRTLRNRLIAFHS